MVVQQRVDIRLLDAVVVIDRIGTDHRDNRRTIGHAMASDLLDRNRQPLVTASARERLEDTVASRRPAGRAAANANLRLGSAGNRLGGGCFLGARHPQKLFEDTGNVIGRDVSENVAVDLNGYRQHATAQTRDLAEREETVCRGVLTRCEFEIVGKRIVKFFRALDIAGRPDANLDLVLAAWLEAKRLVKGGNADDPVDRYFELPRKFGQRVGCEIAVPALKTDQLWKERMDHHGSASRQISSFAPVRTITFPPESAGTAKSFVFIEYFASTVSFSRVAESNNRSPSRLAAMILPPTATGDA